MTDVYLYFSGEDNIDFLICKIFFMTKLFLFFRPQSTW